MDEPTAQSAMELAEQFRDIYAAFDAQFADLTQVDNFGRAMGDNLLSWVGTGKYRKNREQLCKQFNQDVQNQLSELLAALADAPRSEAEEACAVAAQTVLAPVPQKSNRTEDLMRRAVASGMQPLLSYFSRDTLETCCAELQKAYPKRMRLPAERELIRGMEQLLK